MLCLTAEKAEERNMKANDNGPWPWEFWVFVCFLLLQSF